MTARRSEAWASVLAGSLLFLAIACNDGGSSGADGVRSRTLQAVMGSGVAECDAYLTAYESCINAVITDSTTRASALQGLEHTKATWAALANDQVDKQMLARMCTQAQRVLAENSCTWSPSGFGSGGAGGGGTGGGGAGGGGTGAGGSASGGAPGSGGAGDGCTVQSAQQVTVPHSIEFTVPANACIKINQAPWDPDPAKLKVQVRGGSTATFPLGFTWFQHAPPSCTAGGLTGSASFTQLWSEPIVPQSANLAQSCSIVFSFSGSASQTLKLMYFYQ